MSRNLTEKQQKFLDVLFEEAEGDPCTAKQLAGYAPTVGTAAVVNPLQGEIAELTKKFISSVATKAAYSMKQNYGKTYRFRQQRKNGSSKRYLRPRWL